MNTGLPSAVAATLAQHGVDVSEPAPNTWLMKGVPCHATLFNKPKTNLLLVVDRGLHAGAAYVDQDLLPRPGHAALTAMFTADVKSGWRRLQFMPVPGDSDELLRMVLCDCLHSPLRESMHPVLSRRDSQAPAPAVESDPGPCFRMAARKLNTASLPDEIPLVYGSTITRLLSIWRRHDGMRMPVLWGAHPRRQTAILHAAAAEIAAGGGDSVFDVCCPILAAGCSAPVQRDAALNQFLVEARDAGGLLVLRELDVLLSSSREAAAILLAAISTWRLRILGAVSDAAILQRLSTAHPDVRAFLVPVRVKHPPMHTVTHIVADLFARAGIEDTGGMAQRAIARLHREDPLSAFDAARALVSELQRNGELKVFPDDVGTVGGAFWMEIDAMSENEPKKGDRYGTDQET